jgi:adenylylsulfate kinase-like enzyme
VTFGSIIYRNLVPRLQITDYISITVTNMLTSFSEKNRHLQESRESHESHKHMCEQCKVLVVTAVSRYTSRTELQNEYHTLSSLNVTFPIMSGKGKKPL